jgi:SAM-dependent methyltransferase
MAVPSDPVRPTYSPETLAELDAAASTHFWFRHRNRLLAQVLRARLRAVPAPKILEVGCGTGGVLREIERSMPRASLFGVDLFEEAIAFARRNTRATLVAGDLATIDLGGEVDAACAFDVIEHIDHDVATLRLLAATLRPGGIVMVTVPAHDWLWTELDDATFHRRRYSLESLQTALRRAGLTPIFSTYLMSLALPPLWLRRVLLRGRRQPRGGWKDELRVTPVLNGLLLAALVPERWLVQAAHRVPFGSSVLGIATLG